jgi:hypothetical protein
MPSAIAQALDARHMRVPASPHPPGNAESLEGSIPELRCRER